MSDKKPKIVSEKEFGLKPIEQRMLEVLYAQHQEMVSNFLTFIANERLAYKVTPNTLFSAKGDKLTIQELEAEEETKEEVSI